ncbi:heterokaryon incompatibility protein-domain-containing protein [Chaetomium fimeti]|uniref:Heterokaryon incompatibility protein-domain-containing protein n=1 Tax=Chaetomium fimeti TaxID=1854472 RepID=A0AAE0HA53_9PEZI|nr:heterokaryon incompatibility protein-domain-containing protein [Chaetomium fimeti]
MRLLRTDRLEVVDFLGQDIPPYAILSHTWAEEEVTLQDVQQGLSQSRLGYDKVTGACAVAVQDGFEYIWIDTCCIDKTSSSELSEAINSMFKWYSDAEVCYAFLRDVKADEDPHWQWSAFRRSRWFTRGWTLQELIAPGVVYFYGADWKLIGCRDKLLNVIVQVTNINPHYFVTGELSEFSAAQKMSWAANRHTTRPEDEAYCLLGLFDINMPLLYGEGERAFQRLQEEILRQSEDDSLFSHMQDQILATSPPTSLPPGTTFCPPTTTS